MHPIGKFKPGDVIRIKMGQVIGTSKGPKTTRRTYAVKIDHILPASIGGGPPLARWTGRGGHGSWNAVSVYEVELEK